MDVGLSNKNYLGLVALELADRLYKETRQAEMDAAIAWRNGLSKREQEYINVLGRNYIATAHEQK